MKIINVRELRSGIPHLRETLAQEHELLLVSNGQPVARILAVQGVQATPRARSLASHRARMKPLAAGSIEQLIREDRDRR